MERENIEDVYKTTPNTIDCPTTKTILDRMNAHIQSRNNKSYKWSYDDFELGSNLGRGRYGRVYLAREKQTHIVFALKLLHKNEIIRDRVERQVLREIEIQSHLKHPNILNMFTYFDDERFVFLVLEYAAGGELYKKMNSQPEKRFNEKDAAKYMYQVVDALEYCHKKRVIHRDIKPENILLSANDNIKLSDFGWSVHAPNSLRQTMCGTLDYLPPEMILRETYNEQVDHWCIGVLCYEFLVGRPPFESSQSEETYMKIRTTKYVIPSHVSPDAKDLIQKLLCKRPQDRLPLKDVMRHPWILSHYKPPSRNVDNKSEQTFFELTIAD